MAPRTQLGSQWFGRYHHDKQNKTKLILIERLSDFYWEEANHLSIGAQNVYISFQLEDSLLLPSRSHHS
jgi:hypothetical protein